jgi:tripartite-type tricarboxylate transporter receptor subunit TctC
VERLAPDGGEPVGSTAEQFARYIAADMARWGKLVKETGIRFE